MGLRDYARLYDQWYADPVLVECGIEEPAALWLWPFLISFAKSESGSDNPEGLFDTSIGLLESITKVERKRLKKALAALVEAELISLEETGSRKMRVGLIRFNKWQTVSGSTADRQQKYRDKQKTQQNEICREKASESNAPVTNRNVDIDRDRDIEIELNMSKSENSDGSTLAATGKEKKKTKKATEKTEVLEVFDYWIERSGKNPKQIRGGARQLRLRKVAARLADGWTVSELKQVVDYVLASSYHIENGYTDLELMMRNDVKTRGYYEKANAASQQAAGKRNKQDSREPVWNTDDEMSRYLEGLQ